MKIILMRHGNALHGGPDSLRPLSEKGAREAEAAGNFLRSVNEIPDVILHSPLHRSRETAERVEKALRTTGLLRLHEELEPEAPPENFFSKLPAEFAGRTGFDSRIMAIGHEPFISNLASLLLQRSLPFGTGTLLEAESCEPDSGWDLCFYVKAKYLVRLS